VQKLSTLPQQIGYPWVVLQWNATAFTIKEQCFHMMSCCALLQRFASLNLALVKWHFVLPSLGCSNLLHIGHICEALVQIFHLYCGRLCGANMYDMHDKDCAALSRC
jgi:uncharacterized membrane protein